MSLLDFLDAEPQPEPERFARRNDPDTSKVAALGDNYGPATVRVLQTLVECERTCPSRRGATAAEIQLAMDYGSVPAPDRGSVSRRLTSLMRRGLVRDTGERRDGGRGVEVTVYAATREGRAWLTAEAT